MLNKEKLSEEFLEFINGIPHAIFEIVYDIETDLVKFTFLNLTAKDFFKRIIDEEAFESGFKLQELFDSEENLIYFKFRNDLLVNNELVIRNTEYLLNTKIGKQILIQGSFTSKKGKENIIIRGLLCEKSEIIKKEIPKSKLDHYNTIEEEIEKLNDFFTSFNALIMILNEEGKILFVSPNIDESKLYQPKNKIIGKKLNEIFPKGQAKFFTQYINEVFRNGEAISFEYHLPINNKVLWFQCRIIPVYVKDEKFTQTVAIIRDITKW